MFHLPVFVELWVFKTQHAVYVILVNKLINYVPKKTLILTYTVGIIGRQCVLCCQLQIADFFSEELVNKNNILLKFVY